MADLTGLLVGILAVWRITYLFHAEDGPWQLLVRLRRQAGKGFWGELLDCFYCLSVWVAAPFALFIGTHWAEQAMLWPALSGGAILLERLTVRASPGSPPTAFYEEDEEEANGMLWSKEDTTAKRDARDADHEPATSRGIDPK